MVSAPAPHAVPAPEPGLVATLREDLADRAYTVAHTEELLGPVAAAALHREQTVPAARQLAGADDPVVPLLRLFLLGGDVRRRDLDRALPRTGTDGAQALGLVRAAGADAQDEVRAVVDLRPYGAPDGPDWWLASDLGEAVTGAALRADHVLGVGGASTTLAQVTLRTPRRRTLDLGTGCGVQALYASRHSDAVVATDISARALAFARFNAALADVHLDLRQGSMLEPVADLPGGFDLVVSNPPFVITPRGPGDGSGPAGALPRYEYRDGGARGDDLVRDLVEQVGGALSPGGVAQLLGNWEHRRGQDWTERVGEWVDASGLDAWIVQREVLDPAEYAETWLRDGGTTADRDPDRWRAGYAAWLDDFASRDVEAVGFGMVLLRRPLDGRPTLRRLEDRAGPVRQPLGAHLEAALAAHDRLRTTDDDALAAAHLLVAPDVTEERHHTPGAEHPTLVLLRQGDGFGRVVQAGTALAGLVGACDGDLTLGQVLGGLAALLDVPVDRLHAELVPAVRDLVRDGFLHLA